MTLTPDEENIASQYKKMLKMGLPEGAVMQKMAVGQVSQNVQDAVLAEYFGSLEEIENNNNSAAATEDSKETMHDDDRGLEDEIVVDEINYDYSSGDRREYHGNGVSKKPAGDNNNNNNNLATSTMSFYEEEVIAEDDYDESMVEEIIDDEESEFEEEIVEEEYVDNNVSHQDLEAQRNGNIESIYQPNHDALPETATSIPVTTDQRLKATRNVVEDQQGERRRQESMLNTAPNIFSLRREPEKPLPSPNPCWYWLLCLILLGLIGAGAGSGYWLTTRDGDDISIIVPPNRTKPPTAAPSVEVTTYFDDINAGRGCNFDIVANPHPIAQCSCFGKIEIIGADIRERYRYNVENFIPIHFTNYEDDISSCSSRNQALVWVSSGDDTVLTTAQRSQRFALATIFASLDGKQWNNNKNWVTYSNSCTWFGVTCTNDFATELILDRNNLMGMVPSEVSLLERLQFLMVAQNQIDGSIPVSLFSIQALGTVDVSFNKITGVIPPTVGDAFYLNSLNVENNFMSGRLTKSIGKAKNLRFLNLQSNKFVSDLPRELFNLEQLIDLNIGHNQFDGTILQDISKLKMLSRLTLGPNLFTGSIPSTISSLNNLKYLSVSQIEGLDGRIPAEFGFGLTNLEEVIISGTNIEGNIDTSFGLLQKLRVLEFSKNQLRSSIPSELGNLKNLVTLNLELNFLDGSIPDSIGNISTLKQLRLNNNVLEGDIPISFSSLRSLEILKLEANRLKDRVEDGICNLRKGQLDIFVVDCPIEIESDNGIETFGVVCPVPQCCSGCVLQ